MPCERKHIEAIDDRVRAVCRRLISDTPDENWDVTAAIAAVQKALAACDQSPWRSMESAPKDGTRVLVINMHNQVDYIETIRVAEYRKGALYEPQRTETGWRSWCCGRFDDITHWTPLPAAPEVVK